MSFTAPKGCRVTRDVCKRYGWPLTTATTVVDGPNGVFLANAPIIGRKIAKPRRRTKLLMIASDGGGWEHVSARVILVGNPRRHGRCPVWEEMCFVKDLFWSEEDRVVQLHPPRSEYVNNHPDVLHLWRPTGGWPDTHVWPDAILVGIPPANNSQET